MSETAKHTPGPWRYYCGRIWSDAEMVDDDGLVVAAAGDDNGRIDKETLRANNNLIAAAPDLLKACCEMLDDLDTLYSRNNIDISRGWSLAELTRKMEAAVAKADGLPAPS